ncbi:MAG: hypothetical protein M3328_01485, partial [Chloroflexota bacterium]|nr:hypothetical protein [Chloroflexota bacterium]
NMRRAGRPSLRVRRGRTALPDARAPSDTPPKKHKHALTRLVAGGYPARRGLGLRSYWTNFEEEEQR